MKKTGMRISTDVKQNSCRRCGSCCLKGGPVLHMGDKKILLEGYAGHQHLITLRKGELAFNPLNEKLEPIPKELIKVAGNRESWSCFFYNDKESTCTIYENRFLECRLLKCWDTSELFSIIGRDTIIRTDIINAGDPIIEIIDAHEQSCPCNEIEDAVSMILTGKDKSKHFKRLRELVMKDMEIRRFALAEMGLRKEFELFVFGRPVSELLSLRGVSIPFEK